MKIAVTATKPDFSAQVDPRFGRSPYFIIVDSETMDFEAINNSSADAASGA
ncbi:MAG TPA: NifB/NifX family molybdenum-iron cluster-binding protein, partial [Acidobacteriota bacterium]|nr:NifB/NifX family molybdenum-iron cluster-binding protein [Acidobacteriota bacterium]